MWVVKVLRSNVLHESWHSRPLWLRHHWAQVHVAFTLLRLSTWQKKLNARKIYFGSWFQEISTHHSDGAGREAWWSSSDWQQEHEAAAAYRVGDQEADKGTRHRIWRSSKVS